MNWNFLEVFRNKDYDITRAQADWGDVFSAPTNTDGPMGFQFLSKGSVKVLDRNGDFYREYVAGEQLTAPADAPPWAMEKVILVSKDRTDYFCIRSAPAPMDHVVGAFHTFAPGDTFSSQNENFLLAYGKLQTARETVMLARGVQINDTNTYSVLEDSMIVVFE